MIIVILFMIFRIFYYIKILTKNNDDNLINFNKLNNNPNLDIFELNLNINEDLEENEEIKNNNNFDIKNIFKNIDLSKFNFKDFDINDFDLSSIMKKFETNNVKCQCHLCNNCLNKKII